MKFCYLDESGTGGDPVAVMVGVIVDAVRMHKTKTEWQDFMCQLCELTGYDIQEFHAHKFYTGSGVWKKLDGKTRANIISALIYWVKERKHKIVYAAIDVKKHNVATGHVSKISVWSAMALHLTLALQKFHQKIGNNKGHTVLIFDDVVMEKTKFSDVLQAPPEWTYEYYAKKPKSLPFCQIVDVPHFVDSKNVPLVQVADLYSFILRRFFELGNGHSTPAYKDEWERVSTWVGSIREQCIPLTNTFPTQRVCSAAREFIEITPGYHDLNISMTPPNNAMNP